MNPILAWKGASLTARLIAGSIALAIVTGLLWWAVGAPRVALSSARSELAALKAEHTALVTRLGEAEAAAGVKSLEIQSAYDAGIAASARMREQEIGDAYKRGKAVGERITAGTQRVRVEWRDRCPSSTEGAGAGSGEGVAEVSGGRAELIGSLLGAGGGWDAQYAEAIRRLTEAQKIVNACYEKPHVEQ